jgi:tubulin--tyrosine ligase
MSRPASCFINSYTIRKALIRKHFLTATVDHWVAKHPDSILASHVKRSESFEVDYAEFLDDALVEAFDLRASLDRNSDSGGTVEAICQDGSQCSHELGNSAHANRAGRPPTSQPKEWWILKPGMSDRGQGIRLFSTMEELQAIFDGWDASLSDADDDDDDDDNKDKDDAGGEEHEDVRREESAKSSAAFLGDEQRVPADHGECITTSDLRHFVAQPYIDPPLLVPGDPRKFHIRTYVLAIGSLRVIVFREMLALFAAQSYSAPGDSANSNLDAHLTNTCLHSEDATKAVSVSNFWDLPLSSSLKTSVFHQICQVTGEVFEAAARSMTVHFQPLPNAFEVFGVDFLVDADGTAWLLEINAFPDFRQTGDKLRGIVAEFWLEALRLAIGPFVGLDAGIMRGGQDITGEEKAKQAMVLVRDVNLGQRFKAP